MTAEPAANSPNTSHAVVVRGLRKSYGQVEAVRDVSFEVDPGEIFGILGPNGAGKTTTIECILGLRDPDQGTVQVCGIDALRHGPQVKQRIGAALQTTALQDKLTPREAIALFASFYDARLDLDALLARFALTDKANAHFDTLSGGQRQRLALALAFVNDPEVLVLDEPMAGLDPSSRRELHDQIARFKRDGKTVLLTTHQIDEAEELCDRIAIFDRGRVVAIGAPRDLVAKLSGDKTVSLTTSSPLDPAALADLPAVKGLTCNGDVVHFTTSEPTRSLAALMTLLAERGVGVVALSVKAGTLEDVYLERTGAEAEK
ncbi:MAG: ABC transporter ATP-binding protein [Deltaproteobacteria bacterium]|nr:ABC transporter ATP-binding protein [Deltaproteobacteria bacterium]